MSTLICDPQTSGPAPEEGPGILSTLPAGGSPDGDRAFLRWIDHEVPRWNAWLLDHAHRRQVHLRADPLRVYQAMNHLYKHLVGLVFPSGQGPTYSHKKRFLAVQYRLRPAELAAELELYARRLLDEMIPR